MKKYIPNDIKPSLLALLALVIFLALCSFLIIFDAKIKDECHKRGGVNIDGACVKMEILKEE